MKRTLSITIILSLLTISWLNAQGPLTPPGAPSPTMKTLDRVKVARTPIATLPFTISAAGSYYLTGNLHFTAASGSAITIAAGNVTLDLGGFTISSAPGVTGKCIDIAAGLANVTVKNGNITGTSVVTLTGTPPSQAWSILVGGFGYGIYDRSSGARFLDLGIRGCRNEGIESWIDGGKCVVDQVVASSNGGAGISTRFGCVTRCEANLNLGNGIGAERGRVGDCSSTANYGIGINAYQGSVSNSAGSENGGYGIYALGGCAANCSAIGNNGSGINIQGGSATGCTARLNGATDLLANQAVAAFCRAGSIAATGATLTGNQIP